MEINEFIRFGVNILADKLPNNILKNTFLVPNYYPKFTCKGGDCRHTCCSGWDVSIPMDQYYRLMGLQCHQTLRKTIDKTFKVLDHPSTDRYAYINHDYLGNCPLHLPNGYCQLHAKCGEEALPCVCRYYPRGPRTFYGYESSCSNSCERTLEQLFENDDKVTFSKIPLVFKMPYLDKQASVDEQTRYQTIRDLSFKLLQNRNYSLKERILKVGKLLIELDQYPDVLFDSIDLSINSYEVDIEKSFVLIQQMSSWLIDNDTSIKDYCQSIIDDYRDKNLRETYLLHQNHFEKKFINHEILFEKMMINDLFFRQFPFQEYTTNFYDEFITLCALYSFIRYISINATKEVDTLEQYIDLLAKTFRVIAHTKFGKNMMNQLKKFKQTDFDALASLIQL